MLKKYIVFITGASGVGKTTLIDNFKNRHLDGDGYRFEYFDSIGIPSAEEMKRRFGSGEKWQEAMAHEWVKRIIGSYKDGEVVILEGQVNLLFIQEAFRQHGFTNYGIILIDGSDKEVFNRLIKKRLQPELANQEMKNWLLFLRKQAKQLKVPIIDTSEKSEIEVLLEFEQVLANMIAGKE